MFGGRKIYDGKSFFRFGPLETEYEIVVEVNVTRNKEYVSTPGSSLILSDGLVPDQRGGDYFLEMEFVVGLSIDHMDFDTNNSAKNSRTEKLVKLARTQQLIEFEIENIVEEKWTVTYTYEPPEFQPILSKFVSNSSKLHWVFSSNNDSSLYILEVTHSGSSGSVSSKNKVSL